MHGPRIGGLTALALTLTALALPASSGAVIVPQKSIAGVNLEATENSAPVSRLGEPTAKRFGGPFDADQTWYYDGLSVGISDDGKGTGIVVGIRVTGRAERTGDGVGVGSSETRVKREVRGVRCRTIRGPRTCYVGKFEPGFQITQFVIRRDRVRYVSLSIAPDGAASTARSRPACTPRGSRGMVATREARVYQDRREGVYGCWRATKRRIYLGSHTPGDGAQGESKIERVQLAGRFVAYAYTYTYGVDVETPVCLCVADLRRGRLVVSHKSGESEVPFFSAITDIVLKRNGAVAFITHLSGPSNRAHFQVWRIDAGGKALLDEGPQLGPGSLTRSGSTLSWTNAGQPRTAELR